MGRSKLPGQPLRGLSSATRACIRPYHEASSQHGRRAGGRASAPSSVATVAPPHGCPLPLCLYCVCEHVPRFCYISSTTVLPAPHRMPPRCKPPAAPPLSQTGFLSRDLECAQGVGTNMCGRASAPSSVATIVNIDPAATEMMRMAARASTHLARWPKVV